jgi:hypothetical protein
VLVNRDEADKFVLAFINEHPGCTAREVSAALGDSRSRSQERNIAYAALARLEGRGVVKADRSEPTRRWHPAVPRERDQLLLEEIARLRQRIAELEHANEQLEFDRDYVEAARERLAEVWERAPVYLRHSLEWSMVDLGRALGEVPTKEDAHDDRSIERPSV